METDGEGRKMQVLPLFHIARISEEMGNLQGLSRESSDFSQENRD